MVVSDIMNPKPATISPEATLAEALDVMAQQRTKHLVAVETGGHVAGVLSDHDLALFYDPVKMTPERWREAKVTQLMSRNPVSVGSQTPVAQAAKLLLDTGYGALPVVDNGELVGILRERDFVAQYLKKA